VVLLLHLPEAAQNLLQVVVYKVVLLLHLPEAALAIPEAAQNLLQVVVYKVVLLLHLPEEEANDLVSVTKILGAKYINKGSFVAFLSI
jgi:hypothetical protein